MSHVSILPTAESGSEVSTEPGSSPGKIYSVMPKVAADIGAIGKERTNEHQRYKFRGIDDVLDAVHGPLTKHGVFILTEVLDSQSERFTTSNDKPSVSVRLKMRVSFVADDGSSVSTVTLGEGVDTSDKATNKAMSAALKYAFFQTFTIPLSESGIDSENDNPEPPPPDNPPPPPRPKEAPQISIGAAGVKELFHLAKQMGGWEDKDALLEALHGVRGCEEKLAETPVEVFEALATVCKRGPDPLGDALDVDTTEGQDEDQDDDGYPFAFLAMLPAVAYLVNLLQVL